MEELLDHNLEEDPWLPYEELIEWRKLSSLVKYVCFLHLLDQYLLICHWCLSLKVLGLQTFYQEMLHDLPD